MIKTWEISILLRLLCIWIFLFTFPCLQQPSLQHIQQHEAKSLFHRVTWRIYSCAKNTSIYICTGPAWELWVSRKSELLNMSAGTDSIGACFGQMLTEHHYILRIFHKMSFIKKWQWTLFSCCALMIFQTTFTAVLQKHINLVPISDIQNKNNSVCL